jgi:gluconolactonase
VSSTGEKIGVIEVRGASNLAFGGPDRKTLFITAGGNLYSLPTKVAGL